MCYQCRRRRLRAKKRGDGFLEINREFHRHLESLGIPHEYIEHRGMHAWDYWDVHIQESIEFAKHDLGIEP